jgi:hypothetical protein
MAHRIMRGGIIIGLFIVSAILSSCFPPQIPATQKSPLPGEIPSQTSSYPEGSTDKELKITPSPILRDTTPIIAKQTHSTPLNKNNPPQYPLVSQNLPPENWQEWPVVPDVSEHTRDIYKKGIALGNDPNAFSKIGDCQNVESYFLGVFDQRSKYSLGPYDELQSTIDHFSGSFNRKSVAVKGGFNVASVLSPLKSDPELCNKDENPLKCEYRIQKPSIAFISMEQWWGNRPASAYEKYLRQIVEYLLDHGVVPVLVTKADNLEGDHSINAAIARVAADYDIPLWNFWLAVQPLPHHGLWKDGFHLTYDQSYFDDPNVFQSAWPIRNLTALQALSTVWHAVSQ